MMTLAPSRVNWQKIVRKSIRIFNRILLLYKKPILFLDSSLRQLDWIEISANEIRVAGIKRLQPVLQARISLNVPCPEGHHCPNQWPDVKYKGISLSDAVIYSVCVDLEIASHELNLKCQAHVECINKWIWIARHCCHEIEAYIQRLRPKYIVIMQGYFIEASIARQLASRYCFNVIALENTLDKDRIICEAISGISVNRTSAASWHERSVYALRSKNEMSQASEISLSKDVLSPNNKSEDHRSPNQQYDWKAAKGKRILFMAQCYTDSSLLFADTRDYSTVEIVDSLKKYVGSGRYELVIKLHPKEDGGTNPLLKPYNGLTMRKITESRVLEGAGEYIEIDSSNKYSSPDLLRNCDVVVTINSQAGIEGLALGKEVVTCGRSFYDFLRCTWSINDIRLLAPTLDLILNSNARLNDAEKIKFFIESYLGEFCIKRNAAALMDCILDRSPSSRQKGLCHERISSLFEKQ